MRREAVTRTRVVELALAIADVEGLQALTMRRLADALGTSPMAAYKHIRSKPELLEAMVEATMETVPEPDPHISVHDQLRGFFTDMYTALDRHPSAGHVMIAGRVAGPVTQRRGQRVMHALETAGMSPEDAATAFVSLASFTVGAALVASVRPEDSDEPFTIGLEHLLAGFIGLGP